MAKKKTSKKKAAKKERKFNAATYHADRAKALKEANK